MAESFWEMCSFSPSGSCSVRGFGSFFSSGCCAAAGAAPASRNPDRRTGRSFTRRLAGFIALPCCLRRLFYEPGCPRVKLGLGPERLVEVGALLADGRGQRVVGGEVEEVR